MTQHPQDPLARWLAAERAGSDSEAQAAADLALGRLLAELDRPAPAPGFAERVMLRAAAAGALPVPVPSAAALPLWAGFRTAVRSTWGRAVLVLLLVAVALGSSLAFGLLQPLFEIAGWSAGRLSPGALVTVLVDAVGTFGTALAGSLAALQKAEVLRRALAESLGSPAVAGLLGLCLALSALAFRLVHDTLQRERSWSYVDSI
jgi:hypothetical protein